MCKYHQQPLKFHCWFVSVERRFLFCACRKWFVGHHFHSFIFLKDNVFFNIMLYEYDKVRLRNSKASQKTKIINSVMPLQ